MTVRVPTHDEGTALFWEFSTDSYDIAFGLFFEWNKAPEETEVSVHVSDSEDEDLDNDEYLGETEGLSSTPAVYVWRLSKFIGGCHVPEGGFMQLLLYFAHQTRVMYRVNHQVRRNLLSTSIWGISGHWWAATVVTYCPGRMVEHSKLKSTGGFF